MELWVYIKVFLYCVKWRHRNCTSSYEKHSSWIHSLGKFWTHKILLCKEERSCSFRIRNGLQFAWRRNRRFSVLVLVLSYWYDLNFQKMTVTDVIKSSIQTDNIVKEQRKYKTVGQTAKLLWQEGGWRRFYKGFTPCLIRSVPANAIMLWTVAAVTDSIPII